MLRQTKADFGDNDAIMDDMAGQAYVEQFGLKTFLRAENAMKANKASRYCLLGWDWG
jgi:vacuolar protein sorting-associated protein VTA1